MEWHEKSAESVLTELGTSFNGLSQTEAEARLAKYGLNVIPEKKKESALQMFLSQFKNFLVIILIAAAVVSFFLGEALDGIAIIAIVILNAAFGFLQERKAEKTLDALKKISASKSKVLRDGDVKIIDSCNIVPGDIVVLEVGDRVPADCRIVEENNLRADESILTGESTASSKTSSALAGKLAVPDRKNMLFSGTTIVYGRCKAVAVATGASSEFGKIASELQGKDDATPLQKKLEVLGKNLGEIILAISALVFFVGFYHGIELLEIFLTSVSLAVAAIPEGLPAIVTITLAIGLVRMAKKNSIIRKLPAAETLGSTTVICSDKTGTLTKNEMTVRRLYAGGKIIEVTGEGYETKGRFLSGRKDARSDDIELLLTAGLLCNNAVLGKEKDQNIGDPTEIALIVSAAKYGISDERNAMKKVKEIEFDSNRKMMSIAYEINGRRAMYTKGAVEEVLKKCKYVCANGKARQMNDVEAKKIMDANERLSKNALRVLAFAVRHAGDEIKESDLVFVGLQGMIDPPRGEVRESIKNCKAAGIKVVMITGDHRNTAVAIAQELGIFEKDSKAITGEELDAMHDSEFNDIVDSVSVYARVSPEHKVRICEALKKKNHIVAMTGDGVNDAPALKKADIGIAMGIAGTDVAKEASDLVLTDDNFASIVSAVEEGRGIYDNIKKFINYLLSCNIAEIMVVLFGLMLNLPLPLLPLQLLWMNFVTDGLPALALGAEPYDPDIMQRKPRDPKEKILDKKSLEFIAIVGIALTVMVMYLFVSELPDEARARTMAFTSLVVLELAVALSFRSPKYLYGNGIGKNKKLWAAIGSSLVLQVVAVQLPFFNQIFDTVPLSLYDWMRIGVSAFIVFTAIEINKVLRLQKHFYAAGRRISRR